MRGRHRLDPGDGARLRPVIGITTYAQEASFGAWTLPAAFVPLDYVRAVELAGGRSLLVPPSEDGVEETLDAIDGLVLSGGGDLDPAAYGAVAHPATDEPQARRDRAELALLRAALDRDLPTLAICRGSQLLNVVMGGDLVQHLPEVVGDDMHKQVPGTFSEHTVRIDPSSRLGRAVQSDRPVMSHHHQGFGRLGEGLVETAWAADGTLEGIENPARRFTVGVLWHPEAGEDAALFDALVGEARSYRASRGAR
ncbi:MAG: gamma-glutamyl-gamma-aminobutyrate hydrolase family protein [Gaiellaceae bacterium]